MISSHHLVWIANLTFSEIHLEDSAAPPFLLYHEAPTDANWNATTKSFDHNFIVDWLTWNPGEHFVQACFTHVLKHSTASPPLVLDVGANAGFYGILSLAYGANVVFFDAQPSCWQWIESALHANNVYSSTSAHFSKVFERAQLVTAAIATQRSQLKVERPTIRVDRSSGCDGQYSLRFLQVKDEKAQAAAPIKREIDTVRVLGLDSVGGLLRDALLSSKSSTPPWSAAPTPIPPPISLVKIDVEGMELGVLSTNFMELLSRKQIANLVIEITPTWWSQNMVHGHTTATSVNDAGTIFSQISSFGYRIIPNTLHKCAPYLTTRVSCKGLLPYTRCAADKAAQTAVAGETPDKDRPLRPDDSCSQLNASSTSLVQGYLKLGLATQMSHQHHQCRTQWRCKVQEDWWIFLP